MKKILTKTRAVIFDMDGVITNTMPDHFQAWKKVLGQEGIAVTHYDVYSREGQRGPSSVREILASHDRAMTASQLKAILDRKEELFKKIVRVRFVTGARSFLKRLRREKFTLALVTGTARHEVHKILPNEVYNLFDLVVTGSDVRIGKPHPEPFLLALKKLGLAAKDAVVIENAPFGITSAKAAGIRCVALETSLPRKYLKAANHIFSSIHELIQKMAFVHPENFRSEK